MCNPRVPLIPEQVARRVVATGGRGDTLTMLQEAGGHGYTTLIHATIHSLTHSPLIKCTKWPPRQHNGPQTYTCQHSWALHPNIHKDMRAIHSHKQVGQKKREGLEGASVDKPKTTIPPLWPSHLLVCGSVCACSKTDWFQAIIIYFTSWFYIWIWHPSMKKKKQSLLRSKYISLKLYIFMAAWKKSHVMVSWKLLWIDHNDSIV